jgi:hypothetical protein
MKSSLWVVVGLIALLPTLARAEAGGDMRASIERLLNGRADHFVSLRGQAIRPNHWKSTVAPPGTYCVVSQNEHDAAIDCSSGPKDDSKLWATLIAEKDAQVIYQNLRTAFRSVEPDWVWYQATMHPPNAQLLWAGPRNGEFYVSFAYIKNDSNFAGVVFQISDKPYSPDYPLEEVSPERR